MVNYTVLIGAFVDGIATEGMDDSITGIESELKATDSDIRRVSSPKR